MMRMMQQTIAEVENRKPKESDLEEARARVEMLFRRGPLRREEFANLPTREPAWVTAIMANHAPPAPCLDT